MSILNIHSLFLTHALYNKMMIVDPNFILLIREKKKKGDWTSFLTTGLAKTKRVHKLVTGREASQVH